MSVTVSVKQKPPRLLPPSRLDRSAPRNRVTRHSTQPTVMIGTWDFSSDPGLVWEHLGQTHLLRLGASLRSMVAELMRTNTCPLAPGTSRNARRVASLRQSPSRTKAVFPLGAGIPCRVPDGFSAQIRVVLLGVTGPGRDRVDQLPVGECVAVTAQSRASVETTSRRRRSIERASVADISFGRGRQQRHIAKPTS
jgi:hypothetical protein